MKQWMVMILLGLMAVAGFCFGENPPDTAWTMRYGGMSNYPDYAKGICTDAAGDVYVAGYHSGVNPYNQIGIVKYNGTNGDTIWTRVVTASGNININCCALDSSGRLLLAGALSGNYYILCCTASTGDTVWSRTYDSPYQHTDRAYGCACDDSGHLYVAGYSSSDGVTGDYLTIKFNAATGDTIWTRRYSNGSDQAYGCATAIDGSIYVTGNTGTVKYASSGDTLWTRRIGGNACATDSVGNVYVTGDSGMCKYTSTGDSLWRKPYVGKGCAFADGRIFVTGTAGPAGDEDFLTMCFDPIDGDSVWAARYNGAADSSDIGWACAADKSGHLFATGYSIHPYQYDYLTVKYDAGTGAALWTKYYNIPFGPVTTIGWGCAVDTARDKCYVACGSYCPDDFRNMDFSTLQIQTSSGTLSGSAVFDDQLHQMNWGYRCAMDPAATALYVSGISAPVYGRKDAWTLVRCDPGSWDTLWARQYHLGSFGDLVFGCRVDHAGQAVYQCGYLGDSVITTLMDGCLLKCDANDGDSLWLRRYHCPLDSGAGYFGIAPSRSDDTIFVCGSTSNGAYSIGLIEALHSAAGDTCWSRTYDPGTPSCLMDCALGKTGDTLYAVGSCGYDGLLTAVDAITGNTLYTRRYCCDSSAFYCCHLDPSGRYLYAAGFDWFRLDSMRCLVVKYDAITGDTIWSKRVQFPDSRNLVIWSCDIDQNDDLYLAGYNYDGHSYRALAIKLSTSITGVEGSIPTVASPLALSRNRPNPFRVQTTIAYQLTAAGPVTLFVYNIAGQLVQTLVNGVQAAGGHRVTWDGADMDGVRVSSGIYFYRLSIPGRDATCKMTLLR